ncbi:MAG: strawberry notch-like NTP hydrolase domain-containing protein, partial [Pyrinomonadaceae bacterium]
MNDYYVDRAQRRAVEEIEVSAFDPRLASTLHVTRDKHSHIQAENSAAITLSSVVPDEIDEASEFAASEQLLVPKMENLEDSVNFPNSTDEPVSLTVRESKTSITYLPRPITIDELAAQSKNSRAIYYAEQTALRRQAAAYLNQLEKFDYSAAETIEPENIDSATSNLRQFMARESHPELENPEAIKEFSLQFVQAKEIVEPDPLDKEQTETLTKGEAVLNLPEQTSDNQKSSEITHKATAQIVVQYDDNSLKEEPAGVISGTQKLAEAVRTKLNDGLSIGDNRHFNTLAEEHFSGTIAAGTFSSKDAYDALELGVNSYLLENAKRLVANNPHESLTELRGLLQKLPRQSHRTDEQIKFQQFSTPPTQSFVAFLATGARKGDILLEPSAGTGGLALWSKGLEIDTKVNEISLRRKGTLLMLGFGEVTQADAQFLNDTLPPEIKPTIILMNPPFSATGGRTENNQTKYGAEHVTDALARLETGGRLVAIVGEGMDIGKPAFSGWWKDVMSKYNVRANIGIPGEEYGKYGTTFGNNLLVIDKTGPTPGESLNEQVKNIAALGQRDNLEAVLADILPIGAERLAVQNKWLQVEEQKSEIPIQRVSDGELAEIAPQSESNQNQNKEQKNEHNTNSDKRRIDTGNGEIAVAGNLRSDGGDRGAASELRDLRTANNWHHEQRPILFDPPFRADESAKGFDQAQATESGIAVGVIEPQGVSPVDAHAGIGTRDGRSEPVISDPSGNGTVSGSVENTESKLADPVSIIQSTVSFAKNTEKREQVATGAVAYKPAKLVGGRIHPGDIVESSSMASVEPPDITYTPQIDPRIINDGKLSALQYEAVVYAGQRHEQRLPDGARAGFFIGDGTGVGKGRELSGIALDNWNQDRRRVLWLSINYDLVPSTERDLRDLGARELKLASLDKFAPNSKLDESVGDAVLFASYSTLIGKAKDGSTRLDQIREWLGEDGVILFDEGHLAKNAVSSGMQKASQRGETVVDLQTGEKSNPNWRIVYSSATGAT